jgi:peptidoglycan hydrolase-like protein with peptidoglycan-binding domain
MVSFTEAKTKKKPHAATPHKGHPGAAHASSHKPEMVHRDSTKGSKRKSHAHGRKTARRHGQKQIDSARTREIQAALIRANYMQGEPTGRWDQTTKVAMARFQSDNGWQSRTLPDSRALIKLGLGPSRDHLLNPETAMISRPESAGGGQKETEFAAPAARPSLDGISDPLSPHSSTPANETIVSPARDRSGTSAGSQQEHMMPAVTPQ